MRRVVLIASTLLLGVPLAAHAQRETEQQPYSERRAQLLRDVERAQQQLADVRARRLELQTRVENVIAQMMQQRAQALLLAEEQDALQQLDALLTTAQDNLLAQRERFDELGNAVRGRTGAVLVVLLRADSAHGATVEQATIRVNDVDVGRRTYTAASNLALQHGAVDQLYRSTILPIQQTVSIEVVVNGRPVTHRIAVQVERETVTYVQFSVRDGQLVPSTWTSRGTTPF